MHDYIAETLGLYTEKRTATKLLDYFTNTMECTNDTPTALFMNDVYTFEQNTVY